MSYKGTRTDITAPRIPDLDFVRNAALRIQAGFKNRAFSTGSATVPTATTAASPLFFGLAQVNAKTSGIFEASVTCSYTGATATDTFDFQVTTQTRGAPGILFTGATQVGPGAFVNSGAGGILITGGPFGSIVQYDSGPQVQGTAATTGSFSWDGIIMNSIASNTEVPFVDGNSVTLLVSLNRSAASMTFTGFSIKLIELP